MYGPSGGSYSAGPSSYGGSGGSSFGAGPTFGSGLGSGLRNIEWDLKQLPVFEKNFYIEHPAVQRRSEEDANYWRREHGITVFGEGIPKPVMSFEEASMPEYVLREVLKQGFDKRKIILALLVRTMASSRKPRRAFFAATPIQSQGWPMALLGRDMIGISATGSGKTLAFLLPAMIHINAQVLPIAA